MRGQRAAEGYRRVGDGPLGAGQGCRPVLIEQPASLVPLTIERFDGEQAEVLPADTAVEVHLHSRQIALDSRPNDASGCH